ncbi:MAG: DUF4975 domain-containing protein [Lachnospiraceae bacterium]|nr:DUF4975 domain-containing protein [Lachnospiraceae bacterium]
MKRASYAVVLSLILCLAMLFSACAPKETKPANVAEDGEAFVFPENEKDFAALRTPGSQEAAYSYDIFFLPDLDNGVQPFVGDTMPYYEDGVYYIYYLKEGGDSYNHSIYLLTTKDFITYEDQDEVVLEASRSGGQDGWIGTGSVVKVKDEYYFFYTGHAGSDSYEYKEKVMVAKSDGLTSFEKVADWEIIPPADLGQKNDFRDPQAYYDPETDTITMTVTASKSNKARILKYTLSSDLQNVTYDGIIFTDPETFWNLECSDTFMLGDKYYLTYSGQDDTLWYAYSDTPYGPYSDPVRLDGDLFYAAKHAEDGKDVYMIGWARRSESVSSTQEVSGWAGNLAVQKVEQNPDGTLTLTPVDELLDQYKDRRQLLVDGMTLSVEAGSSYNYTELCTAYESFVLSGKISFEKNGSFGFAFDYNGRTEKYKTITIDPKDDQILLQFNEGDTTITQTAAVTDPGKTYEFTYIQDGSVGIFYLDGLASLTVRLYGVSGKPIRLFAENNSVTLSELKLYTK